MTAKILNLDAFASPQRTLTLGGKTYNVLGMTVENFIQTTKTAEALENEASTAVRLEATIAMIQRSIPDISADLLKQLTMEQLGMVTKFLRGEMDEQAEPAAAGEGDEKK